MIDMDYMDSPLISIDCDFGNYLTKKKQIESQHMDGRGVPNYAYALDYDSRKKLDAIPGFYETAKTIIRTNVSRQVHEIARTSLAVGPTQFPEVYEIGCKCAKILGIAIPNIYIQNDQTVNACAYAVDDIEPTVVVNSGMLERFTVPELNYVIGHECGHLHNYHGAYHVLGEVVLNVGMIGISALVSATILNLLSFSTKTLLSAWSRASEVTADRAGLLCADSLEDCYSAMAKLMYGGVIGAEHSVDYAAIREQFNDTVESIAKYSEIFDSHPATARRIAAVTEFAECQVYYDWRPDKKTPGAIMRSRRETDERCDRYINLDRKG